MISITSLDLEVNNKQMLCHHVPRVEMSKVQI